MKRTNVVIVIEVANRELDNAILLKSELENRGYFVHILSKTEQFRIRNTDILVTPNCYIKANYEFYRYRFNCTSGRIVNLQYEQVLSPIEENNELYSLDETSRKVIHICWGKHTFDRLTGKHVSPEYLPVTGAILLDTTRPLFDSYWKSRNQIAEEFKLPENKKWILYISSFACFIGSKINEVQKETHTQDNVDRFALVTDSSQKATLSWFDQFLDEHDEYVVIYRPHPVELSSPQVRAVVSKHPDNFRVIQDYEVKQWLKVADIPCTWISTAIAESYFAGKNCLVFRPLPVPEDVDCVLYKGVYAAETYEEFCDQICNYRQSIACFPISREVIEYYYAFNDEYAFENIADVIDREKAKAGYKKEAEYEKNRWKYLFSNHVLLKLMIKKVYRCWYRITGISLMNKSLRERFFIEEWEKTVDNRINRRKGIKIKEEKFREII